jgi:hypothetical protein
MNHKPSLGPREPTPDLVRRYAELAERQQETHDDVSQRSLEITYPDPRKSLKDVGR